MHRLQIKVVPGSRPSLQELYTFWTLQKVPQKVLQKRSTLSHPKHKIQTVAGIPATVCIPSEANEALEAKSCSTHFLP